MKMDIKIKYIDYDECTSTNDVLADFAKNGAENGTVVTARAQTNGKGTNGRSFHSPQKTGVYMSVLLKNISSENMLHVTPLAAVVVSKTLERICNADTRIKWVNDIYIEKKKICGILTIAQSSGKNVDFIIVGIGINLFEPEGGFPKKIENIAGAVLKGYDEKIRKKVIEETAGLLLRDASKLDDEGFRNEMYEYYEAKRITPQELQTNA